MNFKLLNLICFILLLIIKDAILENDEYFSKSILKSLKDKNGQLDSEIDVTSIYRSFNFTLKIKDIFDFKRNKGELIHYYKNEDTYENVSHYRNIYSIQSSFKEAFALHHHTKTCISRNFNQLVARWLPNNPYTTPLSDSSYIFNFTLMGPNVLLELLNYNQAKINDSVKCINLEDEVNRKNAKKCITKFGDLKIKYYLEDKDDYSMIPFKIDVFEKDQIKKQWKLDVRIVYLKFESIFDKEESIVDYRLPIRHSCRRDPRLAKFYPQISTNYPSKFKLEQDISFNYIDKITKKLFECNCFCNKIKPKYINRKYSNKMIVNFNNSLNIAETIDELTNNSIKLIYNTTTKIVNKINLDNNKCLTYKLRSNFTKLNYYYIQQLFINKPLLFNTRKNFTYLGDYKIDTKEYAVFENFIYLKFREYYRPNQQNLTIQNENSPFKSKNQISPQKILLTHYYDRSIDNKYQIPNRIEIHLTSFGGTYNYGNLTIITKSFDTNIDTLDEEYDTSNCEKID